MILTELSKSKEFEYIEEYLKIQPKISLTEANQLMILIEEEQESIIDKIKKTANEKISALNEWYKRQIAAARTKWQGSKLNQEIKKIQNIYKAEKFKIRNEYLTANKKAFSNYNTLKTKVKAGWRATPKYGKIGLGLTAAGLAGGGIYAASKNKN